MSTTPNGQREATLFGHPRGLTYLFTTEMWERFSYYGMRAILVLYLVNYLLLPGHVEQVFGYHAIKGLFESFAGPLDVQPFSSLIYGTYTALVYFTPLIGGYLADQVFGQRKTVIFGALVMAVGEFVLMLPSMLFVGLLLLIIGNGAFKPNISTQVGNLYKPGDSRIDRAYSIFYVGINVGATLSPFVCGTLGEEYGWNWGFFAAGVGMLIGLFTYLFAMRTLPADNLTKSKAAPGGKAKFTGDDWKAVIALLAICIPAIFFWATYEQQGNTINLWAQDFMDRRLIPGVVDWEIPITWFQAFNPIMIVLFTPFIVALWGRQANKGTELSTPMKMSIGCLLVGVSYLILAGVAYLNHVDTGGHAYWIWTAFYFVVLTLGELYLSPVGLSLFARVAPMQIVSLMMGFWLTTSFLGNFLQGYLGSFWSSMPKVHFWLMIAALAAGAGVAVGLMTVVLRPVFDRRLKRDRPLVPEPSPG